MEGSEPPAEDQSNEEVSGQVGTDLGDPWARIDLGRQQRTGLPEVIFAEGKIEQQVLELAATQIRSQGRVLATRVEPKLGKRLRERFAGGEYHEVARVWALGRMSLLAGATVAVVSAGTSDMPVAEEAHRCAAWFGLETERHYDVGVAGLHRILDRLEHLRSASAVIAVAGMDGALPTVIAGLVEAPVIAVPTSVGYGASFEGLAPLLTMLSGCAPGIGVVNIDNGFGAAALAAKMLRPRRSVERTER